MDYVRPSKKDEERFTVRFVYGPVMRRLDGSTCLHMDDRDCSLSQSDLAMGNTCRYLVVAVACVVILQPVLMITYFV
jgi:hypothetical protein